VSSCSYIWLIGKVTRILLHNNVAPKVYYYWISLINRRSVRISSRTMSWVPSTNSKSLIWRTSNGPMLQILCCCQERGEPRASLTSVPRNWPWWCACAHGITGYLGYFPNEIPWPSAIGLATQESLVNLGDKNKYCHARLLSSLSKYAPNRSKAHRKSVPVTRYVRSG
jgi:hypothetical protein